MTLSKNQLRRHALDLVRRSVAEKQPTKAQIKKWRDELGPEVDKILGTTEQVNATPSDTSKE